MATKKELEPELNEKIQKPAATETGTGGYSSVWKEKMDGILSKIAERKPFSYEPGSDALYKQHEVRYVSGGRMAMQDTMGQAAAMTGGYGNSYAQTAGQQTFQNYLQQLNNMVPELYQQAYNRYNQEGQNLQQQYAMAQAADEAAYGRHQDAYNEWANERSFAQSAYDTAYQQDYTDYTNRLNMAQQALEAEREDAKLAQAYEREDAQRLQETAYNTAMAMIQKGTMPSAELLATAGISEADALELAKKYGYRVPGSSSGGSRKKSSGGGDTGDKKTNTPPAIISPDVVTPDKSKSTMSSTSLTNMMNQGKKQQASKTSYETILKNILGR